MASPAGALVPAPHNNPKHWSDLRSPMQQPANGKTAWRNSLRIRRGTVPGGTVPVEPFQRKVGESAAGTPPGATSSAHLVQHVLRLGWSAHVQVKPACSSIFKAAFPSACKGRRRREEEQKRREREEKKRSREEKKKDRWTEARLNAPT
jgi:hypothetical protein